MDSLTLNEKVKFKKFYSLYVMTEEVLRTRLRDTKILEGDYQEDIIYKLEELNKFQI